jgi:hypothetical protein
MFTQLAKAIWLEMLFMHDVGGDTEYGRTWKGFWSPRRRWLRDCERDGFFHSSVFKNK